MPTVVQTNTPTEKGSQMHKKQYPKTFTHNLSNNTVLSMLFSGKRITFHINKHAININHSGRNRDGTRKHTAILLAFYM